ncbi:hydrolase 76 protein [Boothiomyces macroporosus]|uniref:Mannan endo-1,6-alpha-mannosidase n=1 Tax=Boothiomyces macroporosus TaxID=261099 RepID=A0AAD5UGL1_9FUNG|nr:hydrolase 76 protein [Boothiomyces macroporosus]
MFKVLLVSIVYSAVSVDFSSADSIKAATSKIAQQLMSYYRPYPANPPNAREGHIIESTNHDETGFQWYEGGIMWGAMMEYMRATGDNQYTTTVVNGLTLGSSGKIGSFLGANKVINGLAGRWNDDIMWWGLGVVTGPELFGNPTSVMPGGVSYLALIQSTYDDVWAQWDDSCGGGIFWNRNRQDPNKSRKFLKSTITNAQHINIGARLYLMTGNKTYIDNAVKTYNWLKGGIISSDFRIYDGVMSDSTCANSMTDSKYLSDSYNPGTLAGALAWLYKATGDQQYMTAAENIAKKAMDLYSNNGVIQDRCETSANGCAQDQVSPKGTFIRGLAYVYMFTSNQDMKNLIQTTLQNSAKALIPMCDNNWNAYSDYWSTGKSVSTKSVHLQMNALELFNALTLISNNGQSAKLQQPVSAPQTQPQAQPAPGPVDSSATALRALGAIVVVFFMVL